LKLDTVMYKLYFIVSVIILKIKELRVTTRVDLSNISTADTATG